MKSFIFVISLILCLIIIFSIQAHAGDNFFKHTQRGRFTVECFEEDKRLVHCFKKPIIQPKKVTKN